jgi:DNA replication protein DnaD
MERGFLKLYRCIQDSSIWQDRPFDRARAWIDLLLIANHKTSTVRKRGIKITIERGQVGWSERQLSDRWGWSRGKVRRFLDELEVEQQIEQQNGPQNINVTSLITITNYDIYQTDGPQNGPQNGPQTVPQTDRKQYHGEECKEVKTKNLSAFENAVETFLTKKKRKLTGKRYETFEKFWTAFGYKRGKAEAADAWLDIPALTDAIVSAIIAAAKRESMGRPQMIAAGKTPKMAQGWLTGRRWEDEAVASIPGEVIMSTTQRDNIRRTLEAIDAPA